MIEQSARIFVVDDDDSVRRALKRLLKGMGFEVEDYASAADYLAREPFDGVGCVLLDLQMPGIDGVQLQSRLTELKRNIPIIFLTAHGDIPTSVTAMKHGAVDFLTKPVDEKAMSAAIAEALARCRRLMDEQRSRTVLETKLQILSPREREVMRYVIGGARNKQIALDLGISEKTVKVHRGQVMQKTSARSVAELVRLCEAAGIDPMDMAQSSS
jgi:FixJ family two-component response regulator